MADHVGYSAPAAPPLVGRDRELVALREALAAATARRGSLVLIGGEAGIGKTTLAEALLAEAAERGALALVGRCYDLAETPPYGPWADALARVPSGDDSPPGPDFGGGGATSQAALFAQVRDFLAIPAARQPVILLLDDLHWADQASLDLLRSIGRQLADLPLLLLATYRADELTRRHPLYALLPTLEREARASRLDLRALGEDALRTLVGRYALPDGDTTRLVAWLQARAEGNAFFTAQLLRALEDAGVLQRADVGWALGDLGAVGLPTPLQQVLDARLARLGEQARELLAVAAVIGQQVPLGVWAAVAGTDEDNLLDTVERAAEARLLVGLPAGDAMRFTHALVREALYEGTLPMRRRRLHLRAGEALAALPHPDPDAVAHHLRQAGDPRAAEWLVRAGERAQRAYAYPTAAERYEAALTLLERDDTLAERRGWLCYRLAQVRQWGDAGRALAALDEAARLATAAGARVLAAAVLEQRGWHHGRAMDNRRAFAAIEAGAAAVEALSPDERVRLNQMASLSGASSDLNRLQSFLAVYRAWAGDFAGALSLGERFVAQVPPPTAGHGLSAAIAQSVGAAYMGLGIAHAALGRPAAAQRAFAEARAGYRMAEDHLLLGDIVGTELRLVGLTYRPEQLAERRWLSAEVEREFAQARSVGWAVPRLFCLPLDLLEGRWTVARALARDGSERAIIEGARKAALGWGASLAREQGESALAGAQLREALPGGASTAPHEAGIEVPRLFLLGAALATDAGDLPAARAWLAAHDRWLGWSGAVLGRAAGALGWAAYHRAAGDPALAREHAERALAHANEPRQPLALLAAQRLLGELATGSERAAATYLDEALALADACAAPYERALTLLALAELRAVSAQPVAAQELLEDARAILEPLGARPALARASALHARLASAPVPTYPAGLTAREVEVLRLVAQGLSDAQVAERLFVSANTVKTHLRSIYTKLDVPSRTAAARFATDHGFA